MYQKAIPSLAVLSLVFLTSCGHDAITLGERDTEISAGSVVVTSRFPWNVLALDKGFIPGHWRVRWPYKFWTGEIKARSKVLTDGGFILQQIAIIDGIEAGKSPFLRDRNGENPIYQDTMGAAELRDYFFDELGFKPDDSSSQSTQPVSVGHRTGYAFPFRFQEDNAWFSGYGLEYRGLFYALKKGRSLSVIYYFAPRLHYYETHLPRFEEIIRSLRFNPT
jgi:hypothetical protein